MLARRRNEEQPSPPLPRHTRESSQRRDFPLTNEQRERARFWARFRRELQGWPGVLEDFERLLNDRCDAEFLAQTIGAMRLANQVYKKQPAGDSRFVFPGSGFESLAGFTRKKLKTVIRRLDACVNDITNLRISFLASLVPRAHQQLARYIELESRLPSDLKAVVDVTKKAARRLRLRGRPEYDEDIAALIQHVQNRAARPHDREVATLIAFATDDPNFNADTLRTWRMEHQDLLRSCR